MSHSNKLDTGCRTLPEKEMGL
ncbi:uncharacterized protein ARMOST_21436 [Armillaria ostoyae]|uniref:Uncharacterized protein n=1 Tax=Armillaria ostoyae TaxID=47428 RepID=A0A284SA40_ARMOS|nr:uncharacterized protein ARMOST_21436 [Armillaria ostoyae]